MCDAAKRIGVYLRGVVVTSLAERVLGVRKSNTSFDKSTLRSITPYQHTDGSEIDIEVIKLTRLCPYNSLIA